MKSKFTIYGWYEAFTTDEPIKISDLPNIYNKYYAKKGFEFDPGTESIFKMFDKEFNLSKGDSVYLHNYYVIIDKWVDIEQDYVHYILEEEEDEVISNGLPNRGDIAWVRSESTSVWKIGHFSHKECGIYYLRVSPESIGYSHRGNEIRTTNPYKPTEQ